MENGNKDYGAEKRSPLWRHLIVGLSEYFGTTLLVFLSCVGCTFGIQGNVSSMHVSFTAGLAVAVAIQTFAHLSGALVNPSVTIAALVMGQITWTEVPTYLITQVLGSLTGSGLHFVVTNDDHLNDGVCVNLVNPSITVWQALAMETILSIILNLAICASWDERNSDKLDSVSLRIGLLVVVLNLGAGAYTGASMNPSRSFGPAVFSGNYTDHWIYWVGPTLGALFAATVYRFILWRKITY
ncbi:aquaporin AQPAe.a-like [Cylas formicarius]|uniref:aquaporin AQPAe.a-like n=1 Tax=Cylas formicarius TaxID=197179 RepID=UPI002958CD66|nr:aquaporin AQPAe.a-like [Cylas formicarius]